MMRETPGRCDNRSGRPRKTALPIACHLLGPERWIRGMIEIHGNCAREHAFVRDLIVDEFDVRGALGIGIAVVIDGETVTDLWAGHADEAHTRPWRADTASCLFSASKPLAAACVLDLVGRGELELDSPVARYWPEFAQQGKTGVTVRHALSHLAGVPIAESSDPRAIYDPDRLAAALAAQSPLWPAGRQLCFHSFTYGILAAELVWRASGRRLPDHFRDLCARGELDLSFGLDAAWQSRCADAILVPGNALFRMMTDTRTALGRSWRPMAWEAINTPAFRASGFASIGAHGSAAGLAEFYGALANRGRVRGRRLLDDALVAEALTEQAHQHDPFMGAPVRMGIGVMLANEVFPFLGPDSFGQPGLGGVVGLGDSARRLGLGIVCNRLNAGIENPLLIEMLEQLAVTA